MGQSIKHQPNLQIVTREFEGKTFIVMTVGAYSYAIDYAYWLPTSRTHIMVGKYCSLARQLTFNVGRNHSYSNVTTYPLSMIKNSSEQKIKTPHYKNPHQIILGHDVWTGHGVTIMGGVKIGNGAVIGANAVVAKDIPPYAIAVGNPARVVKYRFDAATIKKFLAVKWWNWSPEKIADNLPLMTDVEKFLAAHYSPALDAFPEDDITRQLKNIMTQRGGGYHLIADFRALEPLWPKVVRAFGESNRKDALLIIWLGKDTTAEDSRALTETINLCGDAGERIATVFAHGSQIFSPAALRLGTHFITTREMTTLEALDYLWDTDVKIVSALDDGIFSAT